MRVARFYALDVSKMIQIRNVPDDLHRQLKARAAFAGMLLSEHLPNEVRTVAERPTLEQLRERLMNRSSVRPSPSPARAVGAEREGR